MRTVTIMSVPLYDVDRADDRLNALADAIYHLVQGLGLDRPAISSETRQIFSTAEEMALGDTWDVTRTWRGVKAEGAVDAIQATSRRKHDEVRAHKSPAAATHEAGGES